MPHGFFTIEQWRRPKRGTKRQWTTIRHLEAGHSLSDAIDLLQQMGRPGLYRIAQTQRLIWGEIEAGKLKLRRSHVGSPEALARTAKAFDRDGGRFPVEQARQLRIKAKRAREAGGRRTCP